jgi:hypothetical protein
MKNLIYSPDAETINMVPNRVQHRSFMPESEEKDWTHGEEERQGSSEQRNCGREVFERRGGNSGDVQLKHQSNNFAC